MYERTFMEANAGYALVMRIAFIHRSGRNLTDNVRYSLLVRTSNMLKPNLYSIGRYEICLSGL